MDNNAQQQKEQKIVELKYNFENDGVVNGPNFKENRDMVDQLTKVQNDVMNNAPRTDLSHSYPMSHTPLPSKDQVIQDQNHAKKANNINDQKIGTNGNKGLTKLGKRNGDVNNRMVQPNKPIKKKGNSMTDKIKSLVGRKALGQSNAALEANSETNQGLFNSNFGLKRLFEDKKSGFGVFKASGKVKLAMAIAATISSFAIVLVLIASISTIYTTLDNLGLNAEGLIDSSADKIDKNLEDTNDDSMINSLEHAVSYSFVERGAIYNIKLNNVNILANTNKLDAYDFDISDISEIYPPIKDSANSKYAYAFYYKLSLLNDYYKDLCGKQVLDLPLLVITLKLESDNMNRVFASNLGYIEENELTKKKINDTFSPYFDYYYNWNNYTPSGSTSIHDMEVLAQHMVRVNGVKSCSYDKEKYDEYLKEFVEKKYYLNSGSASGYGTSSSNYFTKYNLTEDQLVQIASLCGQEQGHSNPEGAAAEASLMANKFEVSGGKYANTYSNNGDALYHYVREVGWWAFAGKYMDKRDAKPEIVEAVRDVLINGNRTLPKYVNSHDCPNCGVSKKCPNGKVGDICYVITNGITFSDREGVSNRSNYISHQTTVKNVYGGTATFYGFPSKAGDPFSYKDKKLREKYGDCHYDYNSKQFVDCTPFTDVMVEWAVRIANDESHGYSQLDRASLVDFDCSSLVYFALINSGFSSNELGSTPFTTRSEQAILKKNGFKEIAVNTDLSNLKKGDILWKDGHTEIYIGEGLTVGAHAASNGGISDGQRGDQNGNEISVVNIVRNNYWTYAYRYEG